MSEESARARLLASLRAQGDCELDELIEQARLTSREQVLAALVDAMTETTLERVGELLSAKEATTPAPQQPEPGELGWYVYGVVGADGSELDSVPGIEPEHPTTILVHEDLAAVVSRVELAEFGEQPLREHLADMGWLERTARAHERVLDRTAEQRTLIPMRMCSVYRDRDGVLDLLARERPALKSALAQLEHRSEWGVKVFADLDAATARTAAEDVPAEAGTDGTAYLLKRRDERRQLSELDQQLHDGCELIHARLSAIAADSMVSAPQRPEVSGHPGEMVLNGAYLVDDDRRQQFTAELETMRSELSALELDLVLTGPWPAYNFVPGTIGAAW